MQNLVVAPDDETLRILALGKVFLSRFPNGDAAYADGLRLYSREDLPAFYEHVRYIRSMANRTGTYPQALAQATDLYNVVISLPPTSLEALILAINQNVVEDRTQLLADCTDFLAETSPQQAVGPTAPRFPTVQPTYSLTQPTSPRSPARIVPPTQPQATSPPRTDWNWYVPPIQPQNSQPRSTPGLVDLPPLPPTQIVPGTPTFIPHQNPYTQPGPTVRVHPNPATQPAPVGNAGPGGWTYPYPVGHNGIGPFGEPPGAM